MMQQYWHGILIPSIAPYLLLIFSQLFLDAATILKIMTSCPFFFNAVMFLIPKQLSRPSLCSECLTFHALLLIQNSCLNLNDLNEATCKSYFQFGHSEIKRIIVHLQLLEVIIVPTHADRVLIVEAICLLFCPLSYPYHWFDLQNQFSRHVRALSQIFYYAMHLILQRVKHGVLFFTITYNPLLMFLLLMEFQKQ
jgi:hypothetical protein